MSTLHGKRGLQCSCLVSLTYMSAQYKNVPTGICGQRRPRPDCAYAQSDPGIRCPLIELPGIVEHNEYSEVPDQTD